MSGRHDDAFFLRDSRWMAKRRLTHTSKRGQAKSEISFILHPGLGNVGLE
jgi:hypothetical protein